MSVLRILSRFVIAIVIALTVLGATCIFIPKINQLGDLKRRRDQYQQRIERTQSSIREIQTQQERFRNDPEFVERTARHARLVRPDETVYIFSPPEETPAAP